MIPIYVINLKRRYKQFENFLKNNRKNPLYITRFNAIDGLEENNKQANIKGKNPVHKQTKHGRFGCFLSHLEILKLIAKNHNPTEWVLIAEDDAIIDPLLFRDWYSITSKAEKFNAHIIFLSRTYAKKDQFLYPIVDGFNLVRINDIFYGAQLYMVTGIGAQKILSMKEMDPYDSTPYDVALGIASKRTHDIYGTVKYNVNRKNKNKNKQTDNFYSSHIMAYATLAGTNSSTEEYFENIKESLRENKSIGILLLVLLILSFMGIIICVFIKK
jgi:GR25 family glycosyltransferase involved in LPS biosynthesis